MEKGDLAYWLQGCACCIFFGPTPGGGAAIKAASAMEVFGHMVAGNPRALQQVLPGEMIIIQEDACWVF